MTMTDPIADMLTRLRNAGAVGKTEVRLPTSKLKKAVADVLVAEEYLVEARVQDRQLRLILRYAKGQPKLTNLHRASTPGRRLYAGSRRLPRVRHGLGVAIISTSQGVMSADDARRRHLGGEVLLEVY